MIVCLASIFFLLVPAFIVLSVSLLVVRHFFFFRTYLYLLLVFGIYRKNSPFPAEKGLGRG